MARRFILILFIGSAIGCAGGTLRVSSSPEKAEVSIAGEGEAPRRIGETPLSVDSRVLESASGRYVTLHLKKDGYQAESVVFPTSLFSSSIEVNSRLSELKLPPSCQNSSQAVDRVARGIAAAQSLIKAKQLAEAQARLNALITEYPDVSVLHDLVGNIHYINKNLKEALAAYERSLELDPSNSDTSRIAQKLREIVGVRTPASQGGP